MRIADCHLECQLSEGSHEKVLGWLDRAKPDVLLMQETKLADTDAPVETFQQDGYELVHHGEGGAHEQSRTFTI